jgi:cob(I)alamin adenosyltransferase
MPMPKYKEKKTDKVIAQKGLVLCHIGDGKGKTTAAMGLAVRASGAGMRVFILQFVKAKKKDRRESGEWPLSSEIEFFNNVKIPSSLGQIETEQVGEGFVGILGDRKERDAHIREALRGLELARNLIISNQYQLIILDEILSAVELNLLNSTDIIDLIKLKPEMLHLVITGHDKFPEIIKHCDLVTDMKLKKHPYYEGVLAQPGIDF